MSWLKLKLEELRIDPLRVLADDEQLVSWLGQRDAEQA
jgi:hypothetical protein